MVTLPLAPAIPLPALTRVAVVGAGGPSGLVAVKQLLDAGVSPAQLLAFESRARAGGVWNHQPRPGKMHITWRGAGEPPSVRSDAEVASPTAVGPSAMYDNLHTNLPNEIMNYRYSPFPEGTPTFPSHAQVASYLQNYAEENGLNEVIRWEQRVTAVYHTPGGSDADRWTVESVREATGQREVNTVSHVVLSNGHYNEPYLPPIPGLSSFSGKLLHARWYRRPEDLRDGDIVVVGSRASGSDIARELIQDDLRPDAPPKRTVYQSVRGWKPGDRIWDPDLPWAREITVVPEIVRVDGNVLHLHDGKTLDTVKTIVFATGYLFSYPFLSGAPFDTHPITTSLAPARDGLPPAGGQDITNLNCTDTFYLPDPTLALINLHYQVNPFTLGEATARLIAKSFVRGCIPPLPPLLRATDNPHDIKISYPQEFDNQDNWLAAIGEGDEDGGPKGPWPKSSNATREARANALNWRKQELGY